MMASMGDECEGDDAWFSRWERVRGRDPIRRDLCKFHSPLSSTEAFLRSSLTSAAASFSCASSASTDAVPLTD